MVDLSLPCSSLSRGQRSLCNRNRFCERRQIGLPAVGCRKTRVDIGEFGFQSRGPLFVIAQSGFELIAPGGQIGEGAGQVGKRLFRLRERLIGGSNAAVHTREPLGTGQCLGLQVFLFGIQAIERGCCVGGKRAFTVEVRGELFQTSVEFADPLLGARFFAFQPVAGEDETLQRRRGFGFSFA